MLQVFSNKTKVRKKRVSLLPKRLERGCRDRERWLRDKIISLIIVGARFHTTSYSTLEGMQISRDGTYL